ncbi:hypothetical protein ABIB25_004215 [Nakamurella sp. UYEF19]|uniref:hypothetical protein n=1 Tax=Nakamurella sp. UYEF19 TaxID=1756392 RepID=UPI003393A925
MAGANQHTLENIMLKKIALVGGIVAVAGLGVGGAAWAESNSSASQAVASTSASDDSVVPAVDTVTTASPGAPGTTAVGKAAKGREHKGKHRGLVKRLEKVSHAQWVSKDGKTGSFVTHDAVRGSVTAVSAGSITIKATDGTSETYVVNGSTKVHVKGDKGTTSTVAKVKVGDQVGVLGTGATTRTATQIRDRGVTK